MKRKIERTETRNPSQDEIKDIQVQLESGIPMFKTLIRVDYSPEGLGLILDVGIDENYKKQLLKAGFTEEKLDDIKKQLYAAITEKSKLVGQCISEEYFKMINDKEGALGMTMRFNQMAKAAAEER